MANKGYALIDSATGVIPVSSVFPSMTGSAGKVLTVNGGETGVEWATSGGGGISYTRVEINTGDLAPAATYDVQLTSITYNSGLIDFATLERTAGTASMFKAALYNGDPSSGGVYQSALYGGEWSSSMFPGGGSFYGTIGAAFGGATGVTAPVAFNSTDLWLRFTNADFSNNGTFTLIFRAREVAST